MSELIIPGHVARGERMEQPARVVLSCGHADDIRTCAICGGEAGQQYALDQAVKEAAGGADAVEWLDRAIKFKARSRELALSLGRDHPEAKAARTAASQCVELAKALSAIEGRERGAQDARGSTETDDPTAGMVRVPVGVDLQREAQFHASEAHRLKQEKGLNHPDTLRHQKAARRLSKLAKKQRRS